MPTPPPLATLRECVKPCLLINYGYGSAFSLATLPRCAAHNWPRFTAQLTLILAALGRRDSADDTRVDTLLNPPEEANQIPGMGVAWARALVTEKL